MTILSIVVALVLLEVADRSLGPMRGLPQPVRNALMRIAWQQGWRLQSHDRTTVRLRDPHNNA